MKLGRDRDRHYVPPAPIEEEVVDPDGDPEPEPELRVWRCRIHLRSDNYFELTWGTEPDRSAFVDWLLGVDPSTDAWYKSPDCGFRVADVTGYYLHDYPRRRPE